MFGKLSKRLVSGTSGSRRGLRQHVCTHDTNGVAAAGLARWYDVGWQVPSFTKACFCVLAERGCALSGFNKHCSLFEPSILSFQGHRLIIDRRKVKRYGYRWAEGRRGAGGDLRTVLHVIQAPDKRCILRRVAI